LGIAYRGRCRHYNAAVANNKIIITSLPEYSFVIIFAAIMLRQRECFTIYDDNSITVALIISGNWVVTYHYSISS